MEHWLWIIPAALIFECQGQDKVFQPAGDVIDTEGQTVTLNCTFQTSNLFPNLLWYKQEVNDVPKMLLQKVLTKTEDRSERQKERINAIFRKPSFDLEIQKLQRSDSAVYYCAMRPGSGYKMVFGRGTRLKVEAKANSEPSFYKLQRDDVAVCLATGFSRWDAAKRGDLFNESSPSRSPKDPLYSQVARLSDKDKDKCESGGPGPGRCDPPLQQDETVNLVSLSVLGLRLLLLKTLVFNVLLTLRLWSR